MARDQHDAIPGFRAVAPTIWEHLPQPSELHEKSSTVDSPPSLILMFPWTGAQGRHVEKYTSTYMTLFPRSPILVLSTSAKDLCFRSSARKQTRLRPAISRILSLPYLSDLDVENILVHVFSEGGSNKAVELAEAYYHSTGRRLPCSALCLDSTPGLPRFSRLCNALAKSLPLMPVLRHTGLLIGGTILGGIWILYCGFKGYDDNIISKTRRRLMNETYWDFTAPRCYMYSKTDQMIAYQDIENHVLDSAREGIPVERVCFAESAHCKHILEDRQRYWDAVMLTWKRAAKYAAENIDEMSAEWEQYDAMKDGVQVAVDSCMCSEKSLCM